MPVRLMLIAALSWIALLATASPGRAATPPRLGLPPAGMLYHGVFPGVKSGQEDDITAADVRSYEQSVGRRVAWVYFSDNWFSGRAFPQQTVASITATGSVPFIRLMLRSDTRQNQASPEYALTRIIHGEFDSDWRAWVNAARTVPTPILVEFGTEVNGRWFPWNGVWNGGAQDGPANFKKAYRHLVQISRNEGASNLIWVFHVNHQDIPAEDWNHFENYYPGNEWVDWVGLSVYGAVRPDEDTARPFRELMDAVYPRLTALSADKPIALLEFGTVDHQAGVDQANWAQSALSDLLAQRWPRVIGFSWWNARWQNDDNPAHDSDMRVQDNPALASVFKRLIGDSETIQDRPVIVSDSGQGR